MADVYLDSCLIISLIEGSGFEQKLLRKHIFQHFLYSSELARLETRVSAIRKNAQNDLRRFKIFFTGCKMVNLDRVVFEQATLLRSRSKLKTPDALHLATAIESGCQEFWTDDKQLKSVASQYLRVVDWETLAAKENLDTAADSSNNEQ